MNDEFNSGEACEGLRRQAGGGAVYPEWRGQAEAGGGGGGQGGCLTFRGTGTGSELWRT